jgi:hypothetical protein
MTAGADAYDDGLVQLDSQALTLRRYHFPSGTSKVIPLASIARYEITPLGAFTNRFRIWGSSDLRTWLPLDVGRPLRSTLVTVFLAGDPRWRPAFTPARPDEFTALFTRLVDPKSNASQS